MEVKYFVVLLTLVVLSVVPAQLSSAENIQKEIKFESNNNKQEISIVVESRAGEDGSGGNNEGSNSGGSNPEDVSTAISYNNCQQTGNCCFQYTWPGVVEEKDIPAPVNNTCEWYKKANGASIACFDPFVYTNNNNLKDTGPPNRTELVEGSANRDDWHIYCRKSAGKSCMKYRFYTNNKEKTVINETLFCGSVTETTTNKMIKDGCYKEKSSGTVKEICICDDHLCNSALSYHKFLVFPTLLLPFFLTFIVIPAFLVSTS